MSAKHPMVGLLDAGYVKKDKTNSFHKYSYASDEGVTKQFRDVMKNNNLFIKSAEIIRLEVGEATNPRGETLQHAVLQIRFHLADKDGNEYGPYDGAGSAMDKGDKAVMKAMTAARKYAISQAALVSWGDDDPEADSTVDESMNAFPANGTAKPKSLSAAAKKTLQAADAVAENGLGAVKQVWDMASDVVKKELSGTPEWEGVKAKAEAAQKVPA